MRSDIENPWRRLPWTLGFAFLLWLTLFWVFGRYLSIPEKIPAKQKPIDARLVEIPSPPKPSEPKGVVKPVKPLPKSVPRQKVSPPQKSDAAKPAPSKAEDQKPASPARAEAKTPPAPDASQKGMPGGDEMAARAIYSPKPEIPEEYRQDEMDVLVVARFHVAADGTVKVELVTPSSIPGFNQAILDTLGTWKFFPALKDGKPVDSVQDVRFRFQVK